MCIFRFRYHDPKADRYFRKMYALMISGIVPRPIAFVSSISNEGVENLAPFRSVIESNEVEQNELKIHHWQLVQHGNIQSAYNLHRDQQGS